jgi:hypothetical protein
MRRKYPELDVMKMYATLTLERWEETLRSAVKSRSVERLIAWRYGLQSGLASVVNSGLSTPEIELWVIKRCRDVEQCIKFIVKKRNPLPQLDAKKDPAEFRRKVKEAKKNRNHELEMFLMKSNF